ncbi:MAG: hypothetical protein CMJ58_09865 [Planctomycetaceae bacterium]|nr:hypothetical protein [Planctomycetaceae bacterium]
MGVVVAVLTSPTAIRASPAGRSDVAPRDVVLDPADSVAADLSDFGEAEAAEATDEADSLRAVLRRLEQLEQSVAASDARRAESVSGGAAPFCADVAPAESDCAQCAGYDGGFYVRTTDGNFSLKANCLIQMRYIADWRDLAPGDGDGGEAGFALARAPLIFSGAVLSPQLTYWLILQASRSSGNDYVEECRINYEFENGLYLQFGRFRDPTFMRELDVSYARQMGVERSYQYAVFSTGVQEGLCLSKQNDFLRVMTYFTDGRGSGNAGVAKDFFEDASDFAVSTGFDWKLAGDWTQYGDFASWADEPFAAFLGADLHYEAPESGDSSPGNDLNEFFEWTVDASLERAGWMAFGSFVQRKSLAVGEEIVQNGAQALTAYQIIPDTLEPFFRYEYIDFGGFTNVGAARTAVADSSVNLVSAGANWYFKRHAAKATVEVVHAMDAIPVAVSSAGLLLDASARNGQTVLRTQMQLLF